MLLRKGDFVKISNGKERFWVQILDCVVRDNNLLVIGKIDNHLIGTYSYKYGDIIMFGSDKIYKHYKSKKTFKNIYL
jgi:hypothetical protein